MKKLLNILLIISILSFLYANNTTLNPSEINLTYKILPSEFELYIKSSNNTNIFENPLNIYYKYNYGEELGSISIILYSKGICTLKDTKIEFPIDIVDVRKSQKLYDTILNIESTNVNNLLGSICLDIMSFPTNANTNNTVLYLILDTVKN